MRKTPGYQPGAVDESRYRRLSNWSGSFLRVRPFGAAEF